MTWAGAMDVRTLQLIVVVGLAARVALWLSTTGSNDIRIWERFANEIAVGGVLQEYVTSPRFNHPPLMGYWALFAKSAANALHLPFPQVFKLLPLAADFFAVPLLMSIVRRRGGSERARWGAAAIFSSSLASLWVTSHHGNVDGVCAVLTLYAISLVDERDRPFLAGLVFAAALNVKLIPLVLGPALFIMQARSWRHAFLWCLGLGIGLLPFLAPAISAGPAFYKNAIAYNSHPGRWGIHFFLDAGFKLPVVGDGLKWLDKRYAEIARYLLMASSFVLGIWARRKNRSASDVGAMVISLFLVLTPGFGVQHFVFPMLPIVAVDLRRGFVFSIASGAFLTALYLSYMKFDKFPLASVHVGQVPMFAALLGVVVWIVLVELVVSRLRATR